MSKENIAPPPPTEKFYFLGCFEFENEKVFYAWLNNLHDEIQAGRILLIFGSLGQAHSGFLGFERIIPDLFNGLGLGGEAGDPSTLANAYFVLKAILSLIYLGFFLYVSAKIFRNICSTELGIFGLFDLKTWQNNWDNDLPQGIGHMLIESFGWGIVNLGTFIINCFILFKDNLPEALSDVLLASTFFAFAGMVMIDVANKIGEYYRNWKAEKISGLTFAFNAITYFILGSGAAAGGIFLGIGMLMGALLLPAVALFFVPARFLFTLVKLAVVIYLKTDVNSRTSIIDTIVKGIAGMLFTEKWLTELNNDLDNSQKVKEQKSLQGSLKLYAVCFVCVVLGIVTPLSYLAFAVGLLLYVGYKLYEYKKDREAKAKTTVEQAPVQQPQIEAPKPIAQAELAPVSASQTVTANQEQPPKGFFSFLSWRPACIRGHNIPQPQTNPQALPAPPKPYGTQRDSALPAFTS